MRNITTLTNVRYRKNWLFTMLRSQAWGARNMTKIASKMKAILKKMERFM